MEPTTARMKIATLAFWLIVAGLVAMWASATGVRHWSMLTLGLKVCNTVFLAAGLSLLAAGAWLLLIGSMQRVVVLVGAAAAAVFAVTLAAGIWSGTIPCSTPG